MCCCGVDRQHRIDQRYPTSYSTLPHTTPLTAPHLTNLISHPTPLSPFRINQEMKQEPLPLVRSHSSMSSAFDIISEAVCLF